MADDVVILYRPTGSKELELVAASGYRRWPPRLSERPIFYPVTNEEYAKEIAIQWNIPSNSVGFVTRFSVKKISWRNIKLIKSVARITLNGGYLLKIWKNSTTIWLG